MALKIVSKSLDKYVECTILGFVYDSRKTKVERYVERTHNKSNKQCKKQRGEKKQ